MDPITVRPRNEAVADYYIVRDWCKANDISMSGFFSELLPALAYHVSNRAHTDNPRKVNFDMGDIEFT